MARQRESPPGPPQNNTLATGTVFSRQLQCCNKKQKVQNKSLRHVETCPRDICKPDLSKIRKLASDALHVLLQVEQPVLLDTGPHQKSNMLAIQDDSAVVYCWTNLIATAIFAVVSMVLQLILILSMQLLYLYFDILSRIGYDIDRLILMSNHLDVLFAFS